MNLISLIFCCIICFGLEAVPLVVSAYEAVDSFTVIPVSGPESLVFDLNGEGPYAGVSDGRILMYKGPQLGFVDFAHSSSLRTKKECDGTTDPELGPKCGRALGLGFNYETKDLYIADAYLGLCKVGARGGLAQQLVTTAHEIPFKWLDALDVDSMTGIVYFTDISTKYTIREINEVVKNRDRTGRFMSYNSVTGEVSVLMQELQGPGGLAIGEDSSFILVSEFFSGRILKYWLKGPNATKFDEILTVPSPTNIKRTSTGHFWIATNLNGKHPGGVKIDEFGTVFAEFSLGGIYNGTVITEVHEFKDSIYIASLYLPFASITQKISSGPCLDPTWHI